MSEPIENTEGSINNEDENPKISVSPEGFDEKAKVISRARRKGSRALMYALIVSGVLHFGSLFGLRYQTEISESLAKARGAVAGLLNKVKSGTSNYLTQLRQSFKNSLSSVETLEDVDLGDFFLQTEYLEGGLDKEGLNKAKQKLNELTEKFKKQAEEDKYSKIRVFHSIVQEQGRYKPESSYLSGILNKNAGNCEARAKLMVSLMQRVYPDTPVKLQKYADHWRAIAQIGNVWYALEKETPSKIQNKGLGNTALYKPHALISNYLGKKTEENFISGGEIVKKPQRGITDTYFSLGNDLKQKLTPYGGGPLIEEKKDKRVSYKEAVGIKIASAPSATSDLPDDLQVHFISPEEMEKILSQKKIDEKKDEQREFKITPEMIANAKISGQISLEFKNISDLSPLKGMPIERIGLNETQVTDLSPLKGMPIRIIYLNGTQITDLSPLKGMPINNIVLGHSTVSDLSPLKGMPIRIIYLSGTQITDLSPLKGMPIEEINLSNTQVADLSPLKGMPIEEIGLNETQVTDLRPLKGMPIRIIYLSGTQITDLSPLKGMPIKSILLAYTKVTDLSPLKGMPIRIIYLSGTQITDLSPLKGMPIEEIDLSNTQVADLSPLKGMPIKSILLAYTKVTDLSPLKGMPIENIIR